MKYEKLEKLGLRKHEILLGAIENYIKSDFVITSQNVYKQNLHNISTATLRNELNALEAMGYLKQIHASGGRIPTTKGYKYYVSYLMKDLKFTSESLTDVKNKITSKTSAVSEIVSMVAKLASEATDYPTVVLMNGFNNLVIESIKLIPLMEKNVLFLIKTQLGVIKKDMIIEVSDENCEKASEFLNKNFIGKSVGTMINEIKNFSDEVQNELRSFQNVFNFLVEGLREVICDDTMSMRNQSASRLLENSDSLEESKKMADISENKETIRNILNENFENQEVSFVFGDDEESLNGCALIKAPIMIDGKTIATVGVFGPEKLDYAKIAGALKVLSNELSNKNGGGT